MKSSLLFATAILGVTLAIAGHGGALAKDKVAVLATSPYAVAPGSTWAWAPVTASADPRVANDIVQMRLHQSVETALNGHGLSRVASPVGARYIVSYHVRIRDRVDPQVTGACGFRGACWGAPNVDMNRYAEGTLILDIYDARTGRLLWRAASDKKVTPKDASQEKLDKLVITMTKSLPKA